ncbi:hypothetical protein F444_13494, partial [Phytophthora nicotianae P1976]
FIKNFNLLVSFKYLAILFANLQSATAGACAFRVTRCTAYKMSGLVYIEIHSKLPTKN